MDDCFKRQTVAASPAEPGASLGRLGKPLPIKPSERDLEGSRNSVRSAAFLISIEVHGIALTLLQ